MEAPNDGARWDWPARASAYGYGALADWMGPDPRHPLRSLFDVDDPRTDPRLGALDSLVRQVQAAAPTRWESKRRDFRGLGGPLDEDRAWEALLALRCELVVAVALLQAHLPLEFGRPGTPNPDLLLPTLGCGVEVTRVAPEGVATLMREVRAAVAGLPAVSVRLGVDPYPTRIRTVDRQSVVATIVEATAALAPADVGAVREVSLAVGVPGPGPGAGPLIVTASVTRADEHDVSCSGPTSGRLEESLAAVRGEVLARTSAPRKTRQAQAVPSLLMVDVTAAGLGYFRPLAMWAEDLSRNLPEDGAFDAVGVMVSEVQGTGGRFAVAVRPGAEVSSREAFGALAAAVPFAEAEAALA